MISNRSHHLDMMRALAIVCVLIIHSATRYAVTSSDIVLGNWLSTFTRPCIAVFLFLSGYIMANRAFDAGELGRRLKRVLIPYCFFSVFALAYSFRPQVAAGEEGVFREMAIAFFIGQSFDIYYFVLVICWTYVIYFLVRKYEANIYFVLAFFAGLTLLHNAYLPQLCDRLNALGDLQCPGAYQYRYVFWPLYFFAGVCGQKVGIIEIMRANQRAVLGSWALIFLAYNGLFFLGFSRIEGYDSIVGTLYAVATVMALLSFNVKAPSPLATYLSEKSYFIYLSHIFVVYLVFDAFRRISGEMHYWFSAVSFLLSLLLPIVFYEGQRRLLGDRLAPVLGAS